MIKDIIITTQLFFRHSDSGNTFEFGQPCLLQPGWTQGFIAIFIFFFIIIGINFIILKSQPSEWGGWAWGSCDEDGCRQVTSLYCVPLLLCPSSTYLFSSSLYFSMTSSFQLHLLSPPQTSSFTPVSDKLIPTGAIASVAGTVFDLRTPTRSFLWS